MDNTRATTDGDGGLKNERKNLTVGKDHQEDGAKTSADHSADQWAKATSVSCSVVTTADSACGKAKLPKVDLVIQDPGAAVPSQPQASERELAAAAATKNGGDVLKRLAGATCDPAHAPSAFDAIPQLSLRPDGIADNSGKIVTAEPLRVIQNLQVAATTKVSSLGAARTPAEASQTTPVISASQLAIKESSPGAVVKQEVAKPEVAKTEAMTPATLKTEIVKPEPIKAETAKADVPTVSAATMLIAKPADTKVASAGVDTKVIAGSADTKVVTASADTKLVVQSSDTKVAAAVTDTKTAIQSTNPFQAATQVSLRPDGINDSTGKRVSTEQLVVTPVVYAPAAVERQANAERQTAIVDKPVVERTTLAIASPQESRVVSTSADTRVPIVTEAKSPVADVKLPLTEAKLPPSDKATASINPFQTATQVSLRQDGVTDSTGKRISSEQIAIAPVVFTPAAAERTSDRTVTERSDKGPVEKPATPIEKPTLAIANPSENKTAIASLDSKAIPTDAKLAIPADAKIAAAAEIKTVALESKTVAANPFQAATQVTLRADGINDASGKRVSTEQLSLTPVVYTTSAVDRQTLTIANSTDVRSVVADTRVADTTIKDPRLTDSRVAAPVDAKTAQPTDAKSAVIPSAQPAKAEVQSNPFQAGAQLTLRQDGINESSGKRVSNEQLAAAAPISTAAVVDRQTLAITNPAETKVATQSVDTRALGIPAENKIEVAEAKVPTIQPDTKSQSIGLDAKLASNPFQAATQASLRPDGVNDSAGKRISNEQLNIAVPQVQAQAEKPVTSQTKDVAESKTDSAKFDSSKTEQSKKEQTKTEADSAKTASGIVDKLQVAAAANAPKVLDTTVQSAAGLVVPIAALGLANLTHAAGQEAQAVKAGPLSAPGTFAVISSVEQVAVGKGAKATVAGEVPDGKIATTMANLAGVVGGLKSGAGIHGITGTTDGAQIANASAVAAAAGAAVGAKSETGVKVELKGDAKLDGIKTESGAKAEGAKVEVRTVSERLPLTTKGKKSEEEQEDGDDIVAAKRTIGASGFAGGAATTNSASGLTVNTTVAAGLAVGATIVPFTLPPLEITGAQNGTNSANSALSGTAPDGTKRVDTGAMNGQIDDGKSTTTKDPRPEKEHKAPTQRELVEAIKLLEEKRRVRRTARAQAPARPPKPPQYKPEKRRRCLVAKGDTLESLAQQYLGDKSLAELIYEINKGFWRETRKGGKIYLEFIPGTTVFLPTTEEIKAHRLAKGKAGRATLQFGYVVPRNVRSLRQAIKAYGETVAFEDAADSEETVEIEIAAGARAVIEAGHSQTRPVVYVASAVTQGKVDEHIHAAQLISAPLEQTSRVLKSNQGKELRDLETISRVTTTGNWSVENSAACSARIEVFTDGKWQPVMEYSLGDEAELKYFSLGGRERIVPLDLPHSIIKTMAVNDLNNNRLDYSRKYLLGRKIFC